MRGTGSPADWAGAVLMILLMIGSATALAAGITSSPLWH